MRSSCKVHVCNSVQNLAGKGFRHCGEYWHSEWTINCRNSRRLVLENRALLELMHRDPRFLRSGAEIQSERWEVSDQCGAREAKGVSRRAGSVPPGLIQSHRVWRNAVKTGLSEGRMGHETGSPGAVSAPPLTRLAG